MSQILGYLTLLSPKLVICDPGCGKAIISGEDLGFTVDSCKAGNWEVKLHLDRPTHRTNDEPKSLCLLHTSFSSYEMDELWHRVADGVGGDSGMIGIYDFQFIGSVNYVRADQTWTFDGAPADPSDLWYSMICEDIGTKVPATIHQHGATVNWDGGMDVEIISIDSSVVGVRLTISGWPDRI